MVSMHNVLCSLSVLHASQASMRMHALFAVRRLRPAGVAMSGCQEFDICCGCLVSPHSAHGVLHVFYGAAADSNT